MFTFSCEAPNNAEIIQLIDLHKKELPNTRFTLLPSKVQTALYLLMVKNTEEFQFITCRSDGLIVGAAIFQRPSHSFREYSILLVKNFHLCFFPIFRHLVLFIRDTYESKKSEYVCPDYENLIVIFTDSRYQKQGVASQILGMAPPRIKALTRIDNQSSKKMYLRNGFVEKKRVGNSILFIR